MTTLSVPVLDVSKKRDVPTRLVAQQLGSVLANNRHDGQDMMGAMDRFCSEHGLDLPYPIEVIFEGVCARIAADEVREDEHSMGYRAVLGEFTVIFGDSVPMTGADRIAGMVIETRPGRREVMAGMRCDVCGVNPMVYDNLGPLSGVHCLGGCALPWG